MKKKIAIIGAGFGGLSASAFLAKEGHSVEVFEKNGQPGGRARTWEKDGFTFDMGPSWYWMPDVFDNFFAAFDKKTSDYYHLKRLDPGYRVYFGKDELIDIPADKKALEQLFESIEPGSALQLRAFLEQAAYKYKTGMGDYVFRPSTSITEFLDWRLLKEAFRIQIFKPMSSHVRQYFKNPRLLQLLEFPVLFLGATPQRIPALYSMMNYADLELGTWYPDGGMHMIAKAMAEVATAKGVIFHYNTEVKEIEVKNKQAKRLITNNGSVEFDILIANSDYEHTESKLLAKENRSYSEEYWDSRVMSPSSLLFYLGTSKKLDGLLHHNLFFDEDFDTHAKEIYTSPAWPSKPLFYACCTSKTDAKAAPDGCENLFLLIPLAPGLQDSDEMREKYYNIIMERLEKLTGQEIRSSVIVKRSYAMNDFVNDYHSYKGNAYGLANTLMQTAYFKPSLKSKKVDNLYFTGQLTVPGPGVPPAIISGEVVVKEILKTLT